MPAAVAFCKFVGTISLGLLTGVSYTLSTQSLPSLLTLPSAKPAAYTLHQTTRLAALHIRTLSALASSSLFLAFYLSPSHVRHPYLLWTGFAALASGGLNLAMESRGKERVVKGELGAEAFEGEFNGEIVEKRARDQQFLEFVRAGVSAAGFVMGVVGIWGDGAGRRTISIR